ncbi:MAG: hypothetical protein VX210_12455 [Myxococcota bacterium]|nr:hypothetical protein [Myxococcota bacterium]
MTYSEWSIVSLSPWPQEYITLIWLLLGVGFILVARSYRRSPTRWLLTGLRGLMLLAVGLLLTQPTLQTQEVQRLPSRFPVLLDRSESMTLDLGNGSSRIEAATQWLQSNENALRRELGTTALEYFDLEGTISLSDLDIRPQGETTDLLNGLERTLEQSSGKPASGILVLSDGADQAVLGATPPPKWSKSTVSRLKNLNVPVNVVLLEPARERPDISIEDIYVDEFAFIHNTMRIELELKGRGLKAPTTLPLTLYRDGVPITSQNIEVNPKEPTMAQFEVRPDELGEFLFQVSFPPISGHASSDNDSADFVVKVIRDKIRVLQVVGRPSWDERFLRQHLKENPNVDLISFFILRTPSDDPEVSENELSLIPFPADKIFDTELHTFDVVIFQNFDFRPYYMARYLKNIREAVEGGLGFVMLGGEQSFADGGYPGTELAPIIAFDLDARGLAQTSSGIALTSQGESHPIFDWGNRALSPKDWSNLAQWSSFNRVGNPAADASVLATLQSSDGSTYPVIAAKEVNEGRSLAIATDELWRWRFHGQADGGVASDAYYRFWSNALRWLVRDPQQSRMQVIPERSRIDRKKPLRVRVKVRDQQYLPATDCPIELFIQPIQGGEIVSTQFGKTDELGEFRAELKGLPPGSYRLEANSGCAIRGAERAESRVVIDELSREMKHSNLRSDILMRIAELTGGKVYPVESAPKELGQSIQDLTRIEDKRDKPLWDNAFVLLGLLGLFGAEWSIRRQKGFV